MTVARLEDGRLLSWASDIDQGTLDQAAKAARLPFVVDHVALMPDAHVGMGATVGSVIPTKGAIIPAAVGVDIGCGMIAARTNLKSPDLGDTLDRLVRSLNFYIPAGVGQGHDKALKSWGEWIQNNKPETSAAQALLSKAGKQFGTLGSGNHFVEVCLDERDIVWLVLHSGSRGVGNKLATQHIEKAREIHDILGTELEDRDLAWLQEEWPSFDEYLKDLLWSQAYALGNRESMMRSLRSAMRIIVAPRTEIDYTINCHHNYTNKEFVTVPEDDGALDELWVTRKGAINADRGVMGVIPGSMGTSSYIVEGLGNPKSWWSCSHGAGRRMSRTRARKEITVEQFEEQMANVPSWQSGSAKTLLDEAPAAYKDIDQVMADQSDLVVVRHTLHQVANYKGF